MAQLLILHNPLSRRGRRTARCLARHVPPGREIDWVALSDLASAPLPRDRVIVVGGDGTVNAAATWLHERGASRPLGIVAAGTGNNLARGLGLPLETRAAAAVAFHSSRQAGLDAVLYRPGGGGERLVVQTAALGFPADVAERYDRWRRHGLFRLLAAPLGPFVYRLLGLLFLAVRKWRDQRGETSLSVRLELDGEVLEEEVLALFLGNEKSLGGNFQPCPRARLDDGKLDVCLVRRGAGESYLRLFRRISQGEHLELEDSVVYRQSAGPVEVRLSRPSVLLADGDLWVRDAAFRLEVLPHRFAVFVPDREAEPPGAPGPHRP